MNIEKWVQNFFQSAQNSPVTYPEDKLFLKHRL